MNEKREREAIVELRSKQRTIDELKEQARRGLENQDQMILTLTKQVEEAKGHMKRQEREKQEIEGKLQEVSEQLTAKERATGRDTMANKLRTDRDKEEIGKLKEEIEDRKMYRFRYTSWLLLSNVNQPFIFCFFDNF